MPDYTIALPSKPRVVFEEGMSGMYEIDGLYPGYGHTLGNSLRRIILSSLPGAAITHIKIEGVPHEFSTIEGVKEDVVALTLNLKRLRLSLAGDEPQTMTLKVKGPREVMGADIVAPGQVTILNPELHIAEVTAKTTLEMELTVERGLGYVPKEVLEKERVEIGTLTPDAIFTPIRRVNYEVENMRVGDRTDFNRLRVFVETDGTLTPREALEQSIEIMIHQLKAVIGFEEKEEDETESADETMRGEPALPRGESENPEKRSVAAHEELDKEFLKTRIETLDGLSARTAHALSEANIRTVGGLVRKKAEDLLALEGIGEKAIEEIRDVLAKNGVTLK
ncbi:MAG: DNA-directed RNA polymerase subunit alpha [bacterium]|nr:DNA-directed RNA polymerase subunit alpha [bacterium]MDZ4284702.1 DNA-directed RNA polymerase subunit alpha [Patescibacteria group bacterium]